MLNEYMYKRNSTMARYTKNNKQIDNITNNYSDSPKNDSPER